MNIEDVRLRAEFLALEALVIMITRALRDASPSFAASLPQAARQSAELLTRVHPAGSSAEQGDLLTAELQEAWDRLTQKILRPSKT